MLSFVLEIVSTSTEYHWIMGRGGQGEKKRTLCWTEVEQHTSKVDRWIVIDGEVYDVTAWSMKHPGGSRMIGHYAGQDATVSIPSVNVVYS